MSLEKQLSKGIARLGLSIPASSQERMIEGLYFLQKWNQAYNLTAVTELDAMVTHHLLDSLSVAPYVHGRRLLDVGTGAGFPGIPLALLYPEKQFVLLDSRGKKTRFLLQLAAELKLLNVEVVQARMEGFSATDCFDVIMCRAVGKMADVVAKTEHVVCAKGQWLMMKGAYPRDELGNITRPSVVHELSVPGLTADRHAVIIQNSK